jgi:hypothetical protein
VGSVIPSLHPHVHHPVEETVLFILPHDRQCLYITTSCHGLPRSATIAVMRLTKVLIL